jgi:flagellar biosynthesis protein FlhG
VKSPTPSNSTKRIITVGGGKGGVGKSIVSSNLAAAMAQNGSRVVLVDCDLGAANQHVLFGIDRPVAGLQSLIDRKIDSLEEALTPTALPNLHLVAGTGAAMGAANITHGEKQRIIKKIRTLEADVIIVDVGAGVSYNVLDFFELGSQRLLVVTPQVTSIQTAYSFLKGAVLRTLRHHAEKTSEVDLLEPAVTSKENEKVSRLLARLRDEHPAFADAVFRILGRFGAQIVGNQVSEPSQAGIFHAVSRMINDFLGISVPILGYVGISRRIRESINQRRPMLLSDQNDDNSKIFRQMAEALLLEDVPLEDLLIEEDEPPEKAAPAALEVRSEPAAIPVTAAASAPAAGEGAVASTASLPAAPAPAPSPANPAEAEAAAEGETIEITAGDEEHPVVNPDLDRYTRKHVRHAVDWLASLRNQTLLTAVRIHEISPASVAIECSESFDLGAQLLLVFDQLAQRPSVNVTVTRRIPKGYALEGEIPSPVIFAATTTTTRRAAGTRLAG